MRLPAALSGLLALAISLNAPLAARAADQRAVLTLRVNTVDKSEVTAVLRGDDVLLRRSDLDGAGIRGFDYHGAKAGDLIGLHGLAPNLTYTLDDKSLALNLTVAAAHLDIAVYNYHPPQTLTVSKPARSEFVNYAVSYAAQSGAAVSGEGGTRIGAGIFETTATLAGGGGGAAQTRWIVDSPRAGERMTLGDVTISTGDLGAATDLFGASAERYFGLNPGSLNTVLPGIQGSVDTPAMADIYVNGALVRQEPLQPGQFSFQNLPTGAGPNNTQIVVTDAFGRQQTYSSYFYGADQLLRPGVSDFAYAVGVPHSVYGSEAAGRGPTFAGRYTAGVTDNVTFGSRLEANAGLASGGGEGIFRLHHGVLGLEVAASKNGPDTGGAAAFSYQTVSRALSVNASLLAQTAHYATLSMPSAEDRVLTSGSLSVSTATSAQSSIGLTFSGQRDRDSGAETNLQLSRWIALSHTAMLEFDAGELHTRVGRQMQFAATLNLIPHPGTTANFTTSTQNGQTQAAATLSRSAPSTVSAFGYNAGVIDTAGALAGYATGEYRSATGNYFGTADISGGSSNVYVQAAGALVGIGGHVFATQPLGDAYALADTNGLSGVRVEANGLEVARTNRFGFAVVPALGSYSDNRLTIAPGDVPLDYQIDEGDQRIVPQYRAGEIVRFNLHKVLPVFGSVAVALGAKTIVPAFGILDISSDRAHAASDLGENGEFYFENIAPGRYTAKIRFKGGSCEFPIDIPKTSAHLLRLGTLLCAHGVPS